MNENKYFIIDFDSTLIQVEALEELAEISLKNNPDKESILHKIKNITNLGMEGKLPITDSLSQRIKLLHAGKKHIEMLVKVLENKITPSFLRNKNFFTLYADNIYVISNGFKEYIIPVLAQFGIDEKNIFANAFTYNENGGIMGFDRENILAGENGKLELLKSLQLNGEIYVLGDGYTDYQLKGAGAKTKFFAFTENVKRDMVANNADYVVQSFDEFLNINKVPMEIAFQKNELHALLLENIHQDVVSAFKKEGYAVEALPNDLNEDDLADKIKNVSILGIRSKTKITGKILDNAKNLLAIGVFSVGTDKVDINYCSKKGIIVFNAPYGNTRSVVELAVGEIIMLMRNVFDKNIKLHNGVWDKSAANSFEIRGKKLGIIGYGNIGSQLSILAEALGMEVHYYDVVDRLALGNAKKCGTLAELLKKVDAVSLHTTAGPNNQPLIGDKEFRIMKDGAIFLNLSRGSLVDVESLARHIKAGKIKGAGIDVFPKEPKSNSEEFVSELRNLPNVILTPHIGGSTEEAQKNIAEFVSSKIIGYINYGNSSSSVNFPNIQLPELQNAHRLLHIHENVPGILAQINGILAKHNINIEGQYLKTNEQIGYAITDVNEKYDESVIDDLGKIQHTIKFRILY